MTTYSEPTRTLDLLKRRGRAGAIEPIVLRRGEAGQEISADITEDGAARALAGATLRFCAMNAAGDVVREAARLKSGSPSNRVFYTVSSALTSLEGPTRVAYFEIAEGDDLATTDTLPILVLEDADITQGEAEAYRSRIEQLIADMGDLYEAAEAARQASYYAAEASRWSATEAAIDAQIARVDDAVSDLSDTTDRAEAAIEAMGDISELAVPLMSPDVRGGAKLGGGLMVEDGKLSSKIVFEYETVGDIDMPTVTISY